MHDSILSVSSLVTLMSARSNFSCYIAYRAIRYNWGGKADARSSLTSVTLIRPLQISKDHICFYQSQDVVLISVRAGVQELSWSHSTIEARDVATCKA